jgi:hypothetical protein
MALLTADFDFADIRVYPPGAYHGLVVLDRPEDARIADVLEMIDRFLAWCRTAGSIAGKLIIVDQRRIRWRGG